MNIQIINKKIICNPTSYKDIEILSHLSELKEYESITVDLIDLESIEANKNNSSCCGGMVGWALDAKLKGKKIIILTLNKLLYASTHLEVIKISC